VFVWDGAIIEIACEWQIDADDYQLLDQRRCSFYLFISCSLEAGIGADSHFL